MNYFCRPLKNFKTQEKKFNLLGLTITQILIIEYVDIFNIKY